MHRRFPWQRCYICARWRPYDRHDSTVFIGGRAVNKLFVNIAVKQLFLNMATRRRQTTSLKQSLTSSTQFKPAECPPDGEPKKIKDRGPNCSPDGDSKMKERGHNCNTIVQAFTQKLDLFMSAVKKRHESAGRKLNADEPASKLYVLRYYTTARRVDLAEKSTSKIFRRVVTTFRGRVFWCFYYIHSDGDIFNVTNQKMNKL